MTRPKATKRPKKKSCVNCAEEHQVFPWLHFLSFQLLLLTSVKKLCSTQKNFLKNYPMKADFTLWLHMKNGNKVTWQRFFFRLSMNSLNFQKLNSCFSAFIELRENCDVDTQLLRNLHKTQTHSGWKSHKKSHKMNARNKTIYKFK